MQLKNQGINYKRTHYHFNNIDNKLKVKHETIKMNKRVNINS